MHLEHPHWSAWDAATALALLLAAGLYSEALRRRAPISAANALAFAAGWLSLAIALLAPLESEVAES